MVCEAAPAPLLRREYAVEELSCAACESSVRSALSSLPAVTSVSTSLQHGTVVVEGEASVEAVVDALARGGFSARLIGSGDFTAVPPHVGPPHENAACVAEFKGAAYGTGSLCGVLRVAQLSGMRRVVLALTACHSVVSLTRAQTAHSARVEVSLSGLEAGQAFFVAVHSSGDLSGGADSTGAPLPFAPSAPEGLLLAASASQAGTCAASAVLQGLRAWEVVGRAAVVHLGAPQETQTPQRLAAAVLARAAAVGSNTKRVCACDGTLLFSLP
jgi:copper chaperone for superoxide dismutase